MAKWQPHRQPNTTHSNTPTHSDMPTDSFAYILKARQFKHMSITPEHMYMCQTYSSFHAYSDSHQHVHIHPRTVWLFLSPQNFILKLNPTISVLVIVGFWNVFISWGLYLHKQIKDLLKVLQGVGSLTLAGEGSAFVTSFVLLPYVMWGHSKKILIRC